MKFKELYESQKDLILGHCDKHSVFDIDCDDCVDCVEIDVLDIDNTSNSFTTDEYSEDVMESITKKFVVRDKLKVKKFATNKENHRIEMQDGKPKEIRIQPIEQRKRELGARRAAIKRKQTEIQSQRLRKKSLAKRDQLKLKDDDTKSNTLNPTTGVT